LALGAELALCCLTTGPSHSCSSLDMAAAVYLACLREDKHKGLKLRSGEDGTDSRR
jgi:hypothetical protein